MHPVPRSEHPRPDFRRTEWLNLNGEWEFAETDDSQDELYLSDTPYPDRITVPFCRESKLSGLGRRGFVNNVWYRRTFELPRDWKSSRTLLHIGACDWRTRVWVNGEFLGTHVGGSTPICFEATPHLTTGVNTVIVHAYDDTRSGLQALGKQSPQEESTGCVYTRTTGIWQTVWLEGVGDSFIGDLQITPDADGERVILRAAVNGPWRDLSLVAAARAEGKVVGSVEAAARPTTTVVLDLSSKRQWSPSDPFLYDLTLELRRGGTVLDRVETYFGLRHIQIDGPCILLNGEPIFQRLVLDQGFYPDGIWTAPSDEALRRDIELSMELGFNGARLHQKVFEPRFLYWADRLGYLVWAEFPNWGLNYADPAVNAPVIEEWANVILRDKNHPSIVGWCPFNETPPEAAELQNTVVSLTSALDPSRPVIDTSGFTHSVPHPQALDAHDYEQDPHKFSEKWSGVRPPYPYLTPDGAAGCSVITPFMVSEYGGIGWNTGEGWGYGTNPQSIEEFYARYEGLTNVLLDNRFMFGFCYTQLTDIEQERNGLYTCDRQPKFDVSRIRKINSRTAAYEHDPPLPGWSE